MNELKPYDRCRGKGVINRWGFDESKNGNPLLWFTVSGNELAPPDTYDDSDFTESSPWHTRLTMALTDNTTDWVFSALQKLVKEDDLDLDRFDPEHENPYDLEGLPVTVLFKENEYNGVVRLQSGFVFPKSKKKVNLSSFGKRFMEFRREQMEKAEAEKAASELAVANSHPASLPSDDLPPSLKDAEQPAVPPASKSRKRTKPADVTA